MNMPAARFRVRYPLRAKIVIALACLAVLVELGMLALFMMPLVPLVPVFVAIMIGNACVLADVVRWAASLGSAEPVRELGAETTAGSRRIRSQKAAHAG
jgi:hypothetical protein